MLREMGSGLKYRERRQVMQDEGYSDDGLFSDDEYKPPVSYLQRRRNAICVTSTSTDKETPAGTAHVLSFLNERGLRLLMRKPKSEEEDSDVSSDDDSYMRKASEEPTKNASIQASPRHPAAGRRKPLKYGDVRLPGFLTSRPKGKAVAEPLPLRSTAKDTHTAIGKLSLLQK